jgi:hypothetical protein
LKEFVHELFPVILDMTQSVRIALFFDFLSDLVRQYKDELLKDAAKFLQALVTRILSEIIKCHEKGERNNLIISKCWNVISAMTMGVESYIALHQAEFEQILLPLFDYINHPDRIEFEDEIVMILKQFIRKSKTVTKTQWEILPHLDNIFKKNKNTFGNLFDTLNYYLVYGKEVIAQDPAKVQVFIDLAHKSMNSVAPSVNVHNAEGAIMFQVLF